MSNATYKFDIVDGAVTNRYKLHHGAWKSDPLDANEIAVYDALTQQVIVSETYPARIQIKTYALQGDDYVLESERFTDLAGVPISSDHHHSGFDDSDHDGFDDDDMDRDGLEDDHLSSSDSNHQLRGRGGDDWLEGNSSDDSLDGGLGDDSLDGGSGNDSLKGGKGDDDLDAGSGDDSVDGGSGDDQILAGLGGGDDRYNGGVGSDSVDYSGALAGVTVNLAKGYAVSSGDGDLAGIGKDKLRNIENAVGGDFDDILIGSQAANSLDGGNGNDLIIGGAKSDSLSGGDGADTFKFLKVSDSSVSAYDVINDFSVGDLIDLSGIDAKKGFDKNDSFSFISDANAVTVDNANGAVWFQDGMLYASTDGDVAAEFQLQLSGVVTLTEASLML